MFSQCSEVALSITLNMLWKWQFLKILFIMMLKTNQGIDYVILPLLNTHYLPPPYFHKIQALKPLVIDLIIYSSCKCDAPVM